MTTVQELKAEIERIKERNKRVEADKAWELSWTRRILIFVLTYIVIVVFFVFADLPNPFTNSIVPAAAFVISTLAVPPMKKVWIRHSYKK